MFKLLLFLLGKSFSFIAGGCNYKYLSSAYKFTWALILVASIAETSGYILDHFAHQSNVWLYNVYMLIESFLITISAIYLVSNRIIKFVFIFFFAVNTIYWTTNIYNYSIYVFASSSLILGSIIYTSMYIFILFTKSLFTTIGTFSQPVFWLCLSTILYFGCDLPSMGLHNYFIENNPKLGRRLVNINELLDFIRYPLLGISFILLGRQQSKPLKVAGHV